MGGVVTEEIERKITIIISRGETDLIVVTQSVTSYYLHVITFYLLLDSFHSPRKQFHDLMIRFILTNEYDYFLQPNAVICMYKKKKLYNWVFWVFTVMISEKNYQCFYHIFPGLRTVRKCIFFQNLYDVLFPMHF